MEYDVIIVGAGLAGLVAAKDILEQNSSSKLLVLEASNRVGGRTFTVKTKEGDSVDLGGQWICGSKQIYVAKLAQELEIETVPQYYEGTKILEDEGGHVGKYNSSIPSLPVHALLDFQFNIANVVDAHAAEVPLDDPMNHPDASALDSITVEHFKQKKLWTSGCRTLVDLMTRAVMGAEPCEISFLYFLYYIHSAGNLLSLTEVKDGAQQDKFVGGSNQLTEKLWKRVENSGGEVLLNTPVIKVSQDDVGANVMVEGGRKFRGKFVIMAIPPTQVNKIEFHPILPFQREQLGQRMYMGSYMKIVVIYRTLFWRDKGYSGEFLCANKDVENNPVVFGYDASIKGKDGRITPALVAFIVGRPGHHWTDQPAEKRKKAVISHLVRYFGEEAANPVEYLEKDWNQDPWTRGCPVNHYPAGAMQACYKSLREPIHRMHFCGTETATRWNGYMDGAIQSGHRVAREVVLRMQGNVHWKELAADSHSAAKRHKYSAWSVVVFIGVLTLVIGAFLQYVLPKSTVVSVFANQQ